MPKLNQIVALAGGTKSRAQAAMTAVHHKLQKPALLAGISRNYQPKDDDGDKLPSESVRVQITVADALDDVRDALIEMFDVVATQDSANCEADADVVVDGQTILKGIPATTLIFLEKQLTDMHTLFEKLPTLDPAEEWSYRDDVGSFATVAQQTTRTKKIPKAFEASPATKEHPAQVQVFQEDVIAGYWTQVKFSGAIPEARRKTLLERIVKLISAVKSAREDANGIEVVSVKIGESVFDYLLS